jgi:hypothetical protein
LSSLRIAMSSSCILQAPNTGKQPSAHHQARWICQAPSPAHLCQGDNHARVGSRSAFTDRGCTYAHIWHQLTS